MNFRKMLAGGCAFLAVFFFLAGEATAMGGCEEDCTKCHSLDRGEAREVLSRMKAGDAKILHIRMSPIRGLWEVAVDNGGKQDLLYIDFAKRHAIAGPIVEIGAPTARTGESASLSDDGGVRRLDPSAVPLEGSLVLGDPAARYKVVVFTDPDCPYCRVLHDGLKKVVAERKDIAFFLKLMPLRMHPDAYWKSRSIACGNSLALLEDNFAGRPIPRRECGTDGIDRNLRLAAELGITGTPTLIMPDGGVVLGARDERTIIDLATRHWDEEIRTHIP